MSQKEQALILRLSVVLGGLIIAGILFALHEIRPGNQSGEVQIAPIQTPYDISPTRESSLSRSASAQVAEPVSNVPSLSGDPQTRQKCSVLDIYNGIHHGMTEDDLVKQFGKPQEDQVVGRELMYGGDNTEIKERTDECIPIGRFDGGDTRRLTYKDANHTLLVTVISTLDGEHMQTGTGQPLWVVIQYVLG